MLILSPDTKKESLEGGMAENLFHQVILDHTDRESEHLLALLILTE